MPAINHVLLFFIILIPFVIFFTYLIKKIKISNMMAKKLEVTGYGLLFFALVWQFSIMELLNSIEVLSDYKMDFIYWTLVDKLQVDVPENDFSRTIFENDLMSYYNKAGFEKDELISKIIFGIIYFLSTVFIAIGRFNDLKVTQEPPHVIDDQTSPMNSN
jgi:hypothetical protein